MTNVLVLGVLLVVVLMVLMLLLAPPLLGPVPRRRVERFARRARLRITPGNGNTVIAYLAVTRRWRGGGLLVGLFLAAAWSLLDGRITLSTLAAFAGWFLGAVVAEWRVTSSTAPGPRVASLHPRLLRERLRPAARLLPLLMLGLAGVLGLACLLTVDGAAGRLRAMGLLALAVAAFTVPGLVGRHVLARPQHLSWAPDVLAADDALRDRSLHVLAGATGALLGYPAAQLAADLASQTPAGSAAAGWLHALERACVLALPVAGWWVATRSRPPAAVPASTALAEGATRP